MDLIRPRQLQCCVLTVASVWAPGSPFSLSAPDSHLETTVQEQLLPSHHQYNVSWGTPDINLTTTSRTLTTTLTTTTSTGDNSYSYISVILLLVGRFC